MHGGARGPCGPWGQRIPERPSTTTISNGPNGEMMMMTVVARLCHPRNGDEERGRETETEKSRETETEKGRETETEKGRETETEKGRETEAEKGRHKKDTAK